MSRRCLFFPCHWLLFLSVLAGCSGSSQTGSGSSKTDTPNDGFTHVGFSPTTGLPNDFPLPASFKFVRRSQEKDQFGLLYIKAEFATTESKRNLVEFYREYAKKPDAAWYVESVKSRGVILYQHPAGKIYSKENGGAIIDIHCRSYELRFGGFLTLTYDDAPDGIEIETTVDRDPLIGF